MGLQNSRELSYGPNPSFPGVMEIVSRCLDTSHMKKKHEAGKSFPSTVQNAGFAFFFCEVCLLSAFRSSGHQGRKRRD